MEGTGYLIAANVAVWLGVGGYMFFLALRSRLMDKRIGRLEAERDE